MQEAYTSHPTDVGPFQRPLKATFLPNEERWIVTNAFWTLEDLLLALKLAMTHDESLQNDRAVRLYNATTHEAIPVEIFCG